MWRSRLLYLAALIAAVMFEIYYSRWFSWYLLLFAIVLPVLSLLAGLGGLISARAELRCSGDGRRVSLCFSGQGLASCRAVLSVRDCLSGAVRRETLRAAVGESVSPRLPELGCGAYDIAVSRARAMDALGIFSKRLTLPKPRRVYIMPTPREPEPMPELRTFASPQLRDKPGGGFAEAHEMRDYRPGDSLRDIHWKLSAKTDKLIVRQAQEPVQRTVLITLDRPADREKYSAVLGELLWLSRYLLENGAKHTVCWLSSEGAPELFEVKSENELDELMKRLLSEPLREGTPSLEGRAPLRANWRWHLGAEREGDGR